jgi:N-acyl-D-amino-acid deacylase
MVMRQTKQTAEFYGLTDRGVIAPGCKADLNVIDFEALQLKAPRLVFDLPAQGRRLLQDATGYKYTIVSGVSIFEDGKATGALPGKLLRASSPEQ